MSCHALRLAPATCTAIHLPFSQRAHLPAAIFACFVCCSFVIAISLAPLVQSLAENQMQFQLNVVGLKMRNGLMAAIYRKCLRLRWAGRWCSSSSNAAAAQQAGG
jgi:hypothetical protein